MFKLNEYITEVWSGVKKQSYEQEIKSWCDDMGIEDYTINSKGEIDVDGYVNLSIKDFKELPYKFGIVTDYFDISGCKNLTSLKNCPNEVREYFGCSNCPKLKSLKGSPMMIGGDFVCYGCYQLESLEGCPKKVMGSFYCYDCKRKFTKEEVQSLCKVDQHRISI